jgi:hypothetical protein
MTVNANCLYSTITEMCCAPFCRPLGNFSPPLTLSTPNLILRIQTFTTTKLRRRRRCTSRIASAIIDSKSSILVAIQSSDCIATEDRITASSRLRHECPVKIARPIQTPGPDAGGCWVLGMLAFTWPRSCSAELPSSRRTCFGAFAEENKTRRGSQIGNQPLVHRLPRTSSRERRKPMERDGRHMQRTTYPPMPAGTSTDQPSRHLEFSPSRPTFNKTTLTRVDIRKRALSLSRA